MEIVAGTIKIPNAVCECISILLSAAVPILMLLYIRKKSKASLRPVWFGAVAFFVSVLVLEQAMHFFALVQKNDLSEFINNNLWAYCMYGCLAAGIFEETARFVMFRTFLKKDRSSEVPLLYAIGHGGIESLLIGTLTMSCVFFMALKLNALGSTAVLEGMEPQMQTAFLASYQPLFNGSPFALLAGGIERFSALMIQAALSVVVYIAATQKKRRYLFPAAIVCHAIVDIPAVLYQKEILTGISITEALIFAVAALLLAAVMRWVYPLVTETDIS